jgi:predicted transcriptional regulator of viral defense system
MLQTEKILRIAENNNGFVTSAQVTAAGISRAFLKTLVDSGELDRSSRGVYLLPYAFDDPYLNAQVRLKKGIFSLNTSLYLQDMSLRTPNVIEMAFPAGYKNSSFDELGVTATYENDKVYGVGVIEVKTPSGNTVRAYSPERTLCDIVRPRNSVDIQTISDAYKEYIVRKGKNLNKIIEYAQLLHVENKVRAYLEILL